MLAQQQQQQQFNHFVFSNVAPVSAAVVSRYFPDEPNIAHPDEQSHMFAALQIDDDEKTLQLNLVHVLRGNSASPPPDFFISTRGTRSLFKSPILRQQQQAITIEKKMMMPTCLRLIVVDRGESAMAAVVVAAFHGGRVEAWSFDSAASIEKQHDMNEKSSSSSSTSPPLPLLFLNNSSSTLLCRHTCDVVDDLYHVSRDGSIFIVIVGGGACTVTKLIMTTFRIGGCRADTTATTVGRGLRIKPVRCARHFSPPINRSDAIRYIVDAQKTTLSFIYSDRAIKKKQQQQQHNVGAAAAADDLDRRSEVSSSHVSRAGGADRYRPPPERIFETHFLPALFPSSSSSSSLLLLCKTALPPAAWAGRFSVARGAASCEPPVACGRRIWIEDADAIRADFRRLQDQQLAEKVLPLNVAATHIATSSSSSSSSGSNTSSGSSALLYSSAAQQQQLRILENTLLRSEGGWISGGLSIIAPDICCVVVDFARIVALLRAVAPAGGPLILLADEQQQQQRQRRALSQDEAQEDELVRKTVVLCDTATRLLLARPDCRHPAAAPAASQRRYVDPSERRGKENSHNDDNSFDDHTNNNNNNNNNTLGSRGSGAAAADGNDFFSPRCVCRVPADVVDRAIFAVHATAVALAVPHRAFCAGSDFALAGVFCQVTWPVDRATQLPEFLHTVVRYLLHSECVRVRDASRCFFGACLDRLTAAEKFALQDALCAAWQRQYPVERQQQEPASLNSTTTLQSAETVPAFADLTEPMPKEREESDDDAVLDDHGHAKKDDNDKDDDEEDNNNSNNKKDVKSISVSAWEQLATTMAPTQALVALLLLVRSVRAASVTASAANSSTAAVVKKAAADAASSPSASPLQGKLDNSSMSSTTTTTVAAAAAAAISSFALGGGFTAEDIAELGSYSPPSHVIALVGSALCSVAKEYRCRSTALSIMSGIALRIISEGWSAFSGYISPAERKLMVCRLVMDAVVRPSTSNNNNNSNSSNASAFSSDAAAAISGGSSNQQQQQQQQHLLSQAELTATAPVVQILARICATMSVSKAVELFAWCCALSDPEVVSAARNAGVVSGGGGGGGNAGNAAAGGTASGRGSSSASSMDDSAHIGISIAVLRVLSHVIQLHPVAARRHIHSILSFVWAALDPAGASLSSSAFSGGGGASSAASAASALFSAAAAAASNMMTTESSSKTSSSSSSSSLSSQAATSSVVRTTAAKLSVVALLFRTAVEYLPAFAFHQGTQRVAASAGDDGKIVLYCAKTTSKLAVVNVAWSVAAASATTGVAALAFGPTGDMLVVLSGDATAVSVWTVLESTSLFGLLSTSVSLNKVAEVQVPGRRPQQQEQRQEALPMGASITGASSSFSSPLVSTPAASSSFVFSKPSKLRIIVASPKCAIVSFGIGDDVMVNF